MAGERFRSRTLQTLVASLGARPDPAALRRGFTPPSRFAGKLFENYQPRHPTQTAALEHLRRLPGRLAASGRDGLVGRLLRRRASGSTGIYLDGGFGVGKTHLLASLWHAAPGPKAYLSFDELMYFIGILGPTGAAQAFVDHRLLSVDEWELDDPGNLTIALAFLRRVLAGGVYAVVTSNTLPLELGAGRFSQKDFLAEIEELARVFEVVRIEGDDYRRRSFEADPGRSYFREGPELEAAVVSAPDESVAVTFGELLETLRSLHPIRYRELARRIDRLFVAGVAAIPNVADALRWVHFIDSIYDAGTDLAATGEIPLASLFTTPALEGPYGKKFSRCLSRLEEMLG